MKGSCIRKSKAARESQRGRGRENRDRGGRWQAIIEDRPATLRRLEMRGERECDFKKTRMRKERRGLQESKGEADASKRRGGW